MAGKKRNRDVAFLNWMKFRESQVYEGKKEEGVFYKQSSKEYIKLFLSLIEKHQEPFDKETRMTTKVEVDLAFSALTINEEVKPTLVITTETERWKKEAGANLNFAGRFAVLEEEQNVELSKKLIVIVSYDHVKLHEQLLHSVAWLRVIVDTDRDADSSDDDVDRLRNMFRWTITKVPNLPDRGKKKLTQDTKKKEIQVYMEWAWESNPKKRIVIVSNQIQTLNSVQLLFEKDHPNAKFLKCYGENESRDLPEKEKFKLSKFNNSDANFVLLSKKLGEFQSNAADFVVFMEPSENKAMESKLLKKFKTSQDLSEEIVHLENEETKTTETLARLESAWESNPKKKIVVASHSTETLESVEEQFKEKHPEAKFLKYYGVFAIDEIPEMERYNSGKGEKNCRKEERFNNTDTNCVLFLLGEKRPIDADIVIFMERSRTTDTEYNHLDKFTSTAVIYLD